MTAPGSSGGDRQAADGGSQAVLKTLLLSDLVGSTSLVERLGDQRAFEVFGRHDRLARDLLQRFDGREIDKTDGFLMLFDRPIDAVGYAVAYHQELCRLAEETGIVLVSRVGIHLGEVYLRHNPPEDVARGAKPLEVEGLAKPMAARLMSLAGGRQTLLSAGAFELARRAAVDLSRGRDQLRWEAHGAYRFKGVDEPVEVFEAGVPGIASFTPPADSDKVKRADDGTIVGWRPGPGQEIPERPHWVLEHKLGEGGFGEVWLACHRKTRDQRVFKFCFESDRLRGLQREVTLFRLLKEALGRRDDIARIIDWSFDSAPYFVESEYTAGGSLVEWAANQGGIDRVPLEVRLELVAQTATALAAAHSVGVLHKDIKPHNILISTTGSAPQVRLTDFGIGLLTDTSRLAEHGITVSGFTQELGADSSSATGTWLYMAPELHEGKPSTVQCDIYALGVLLYQLVVGDLRSSSSDRSLKAWTWPELEQRQVVATGKHGNAAFWLDSGRGLGLAGTWGGTFLELHRRQNGWQVSRTVETRSMGIYSVAAQPAAGVVVLVGVNPSDLWLYDLLSERAGRLAHPDLDWQWAIPVGDDIVVVVGHGCVASYRFTRRDTQLHYQARVGLTTRAPTQSIVVDLPSKGWIATGGGDGTIYLLDLDQLPEVVRLDGTWQPPRGAKQGAAS